MFLFVASIETRSWSSIYYTYICSMLGTWFIHPDRVHLFLYALITGSWSGMHYAIIEQGSEGSKHRIIIIQVLYIA